MYVTAILAASYRALRLKNVILLAFGKPTFTLLDMNPRHVALSCIFLLHKLKHAMQWIEIGYPNLITDTAPLSELGGASKINSVQNAILLCSDLHNAWSQYLIAVLPEVFMFHSSMASFLTTFWLAWARGCPICWRLRRCRWKNPQTRSYHGPQFAAS